MSFINKKDKLSKSLQLFHVSREDFLSGDMCVSIPAILLSERACLVSMCEEFVSSYALRMCEMFVSSYELHLLR